MFKWAYCGVGGDIQTTTGLLVATGFTRVVHGGRGAYVEFSKEQMLADGLEIPAGERWRVDSSTAYYIELRTTDSIHAKVYLQKRMVSYADYHPGMFYISPVYLKDFSRTGQKYRMVEV